MFGCRVASRAHIELYVALTAFVLESEDPLVTIVTESSEISVVYFEYFVAEKNKPVITLLGFLITLEPEKFV
jgi:hypothetical protein